MPIHYSRYAQVKIASRYPDHESSKRLDNGGSGDFPTGSTIQQIAALSARGKPRISVTACFWTAGRLNGKCHACLTREARRNNIVVTMRAVHVSIRQIGNSQGIVIPKPVLAQLGLDSKAGAEMTIEDGALVLRRPASPARTGWAEAARRIAEAGDDELVMGEFGNAEDSELVW